MTEVAPDLYLHVFNWTINVKSVLIKYNFSYRIIYQTNSEITKGSLALADVVCHVR